jgi:hypothetical protein
VRAALRQAGRRRVLQEVPGGAGAEGLEDTVLVLVDGERHQPQGRVPLLEQPNAFDPGHAGKSDVAEDDVGQRRAQGGQRLLHGSEGPRAAVARSAVNEEAEALADLTLVFDDGDADVLSHAFSVFPGV